MSPTPWWPEASCGLVAAVTSCNLAPYCAWPTLSYECLKLLNVILGLSSNRYDILMLHSLGDAPHTPEGEVVAVLCWYVFWCI